MMAGANSRGRVGGGGGGSLNDVPLPVRIAFSSSEVAAVKKKKVLSGTESRV